MIITLKKFVPQMEIDRLIHEFEALNLHVNIIHGDNFNVFGIVGDTSRVDERQILANKWVEDVKRIAAPYKLVNRMFHPADSIINVAGINVGGNSPIVIIGGPCSVEGKKPLLDVAVEVKSAQATMLRGGAYKPRTSPYAFQGMGFDGVLALANAREKTGLPVVSEIMSIDKLDEFNKYVDLVQIGARNMQNFDLLKAVGKINKPILLKRGLSATIEEWIMSAEYIMAAGNPNVIFCERGIRTFEKYTRNTLDLAVIPILKEKTHLPIIIDPSHATGDYKLIESTSLAAIAAGADGLMIEVHNTPEKAWSDGAQSLKPEKFKTLIEKSKKVAHAIGREIYEG